MVKICPESAHSLTFGLFIFVSSTQESERELDSIDVETAKLQRHLEVCPKDGATAAVDETSFVESIQQLDQSRKRSRDLLLLTQASVAGRLQHWKLFEDSVNRVLCLIKRLNYARNMASLKGSVDLQRLLAAKQSIEVRNATPYNSNCNSNANVVAKQRGTCLRRFVVCRLGGDKCFPPTEFRGKKAVGCSRLMDYMSSA